MSWRLRGGGAQGGGAGYQWKRTSVFHLAKCFDAKTLCLPCVRNLGDIRSPPSFSSFVLWPLSPASHLRLDVKLKSDSHQIESIGIEPIRIGFKSASGYEASENVIIGNTCLYGATGGALFVNGRAGERFAVRNSMADSVVEVRLENFVCCCHVLYQCAIMQF